MTKAETRKKSQERNRGAKQIRTHVCSLPEMRSNGSDAWKHQEASSKRQVPPRRLVDQRMITGDPSTPEQILHDARVRHTPLCAPRTYPAPQISAHTSRGRDQVLSRIAAPRTRKMRYREPCSPRAGCRKRTQPRVPIPALEETKKPRSTTMAHRPPPQPMTHTSPATDTQVPR